LCGARWRLTCSASASNRPNTRGAVPSGRLFSSSRTNSRCRVRSSGGQPEWARRIAATCAAVLPGVPVSARQPGRALRPGCGARPRAERAPARRTHRGASPGSTGRSCPATSAPRHRTGRRARARPEHALAGRAAWSTTPPRPPPGSANRACPDPLTQPDTGRRCTSCAPLFLVAKEELSP
jgi:hypothetical protein